MASQVRPGLTQPRGNLGLQESDRVIRRQPAHSIRARELASHPQAECMGAIFSCEIKTEEALGNRGRPCMDTPKAHTRNVTDGRGDQSSELQIATPSVRGLGTH